MLYDQDMIDGDTSLEGLVDEEVFLLNTENNSNGTKKTGQIQRVKTRFSKRNRSYDKLNFGHNDLPIRALGGGKQLTGGLGRDVGRNRNQAREHDLQRGQQRKIANRPQKITIDNDTPRRSARCPKPSEKMIQIKKELQEETDSGESDEDFQVVKNSVKERKFIIEVELQGDDKTRIVDKSKTKNDPKKLVCGLRRSSRITKPTKEILEFRKAVNDEDVNKFVRTRGAQHKKLKLTADSEENSLGKIRLRKSVHILQFPNPVDENSNMLPNTRSHTFNTGTALKTSSGKPLDGQWKLTRSISAHSTTMTNSTSNTKLVSSATRALSASPGASTRAGALSAYPGASTQALSASPGASNQSTEVPPSVEMKVDQPPSPGKRNRQPSKSVGICSAGTSRVGEDGENLGLIVLTEVENDEGVVHFGPDALMEPVGDPRNWNCFQVILCLFICLFVTF